MTTEKTYQIVRPTPRGFEVRSPKQLLPIGTFSTQIDAEHYIAFLLSGGGRVLQSKAHLASRIDTIQAVLDTAMDRHNDFRDEVSRLAMGLDRAVAGRPSDPVRNVAPDLLAALKSILYEYAGLVSSGDCGSMVDPEILDTVKAARDAIAKAETK